MKKGVKGWGRRDGQHRVMAYISHSLFNESLIDRAITLYTRPHTHTHTHIHTHTHTHTNIKAQVFCRERLVRFNCYA